MKKIYILSNSYGEDRSGALIGREMLKLCPDIHITAFPLISLGEEYKKRGVPFAICSGVSSSTLRWSPFEII